MSENATSVDEMQKEEINVGESQLKENTDKSEEEKQKPKQETEKKAKDGELPLIPFISAGFMVALTHGPQIRGLLGFLYYG